jgi:hypothetical protein
VERGTPCSTEPRNPETDWTFMNCNIGMTATMDNPYYAIHSHICIRHSLCVPCLSNGVHCESKPGRGASPPRGLRPLGSGGKCLVRGVGVGVARRRGGGGARAERAPAHLSGHSRDSRLSCPRSDAGNSADRARAVPARALRSEPRVRQARLRRTCRPAPTRVDRRQRGSRFGLGVHSVCTDTHNRAATVTGGFASAYDRLSYSRRAR